MDVGPTGIIILIIGIVFGVSQSGKLAEAWQRHSRSSGTDGSDKDDHSIRGQLPLALTYGRGLRKPCPSPLRGTTQRQPQG
jgi:hypothetical protein